MDLGGLRGLGRRWLRSGLAVLALAGVAAAGLGSPALATTSVTRTSSFAYDAATGLLTQEVIEPDDVSGHLRQQTDYTLDSFGNKTTVAVSGGDIATRGTQTTFDARGQFASSVSNALSQSESWQYDARTGQPSSHTGPNGLVTTWSYDSLGRKIQEVRADGTRTTWSYLYCSGVNGGTASCPANGAFLVKTTPLAADGITQTGPVTTVYSDSLGREVGRDGQGFDGSAIRVSTQYDSLGRPLKISRPYFLSGGTPVWTVTSFDAIGRPVAMTFPDSSQTSTAFHGLSVTATNELGQTRTTVKNSQGQVVSVTDAMSGVTHFSYDPFGNLLQTVDAVGNTTTATYDVRGRKLSQNDPDLGSWTYVYDTLSELVSQTDAKSQTATFAYDKLGRMTQRAEPEMTCTWVYDTAAMGIGKLASVSSTLGYLRTHIYDSKGRPTQVTITADGTTPTYTIGASYDANAGRVSQVTYPSGFALAYTYNATGYLSQVANTAGGQTYWMANARDAELHLLNQTAGNGVVTAQTFDANTGRMTAVQAAVGGGTAVASFAYAYDVLGDLSSRQDANESLSESFTYDLLDRVLTAAISGGASKSYAYDAVGNITFKSDVGTYHYPAAGAAHPHAVQTVTDGSGNQVMPAFAYDADGNQTTGGGRTIAYTSFNKPSSITLGTKTISFAHDPEHARLKQTAPEGTTLYLGAFGIVVERFTGSGGGGTWNEYLTVEGRMIGVRFEGSTVLTRYFVADHLGSVAVIADETGAVLERLSYDVWGRRRFPAGADDPSGSIASQTTRGFTGQEELQDVALVHMNGRVYDPYLGRFTSADPFVQDPLNGLSLNRYIYVLDNPLALTDPSGYFSIGHFFHSLFNPRTIVAVAIGVIFMQPEIIGIVGEAFGFGEMVADEIGVQFVGNFAAAQLVSAVIGGTIAGGVQSGTMRGAIAGGVSAGLFDEIGDVAADRHWASGSWEKVAMHAVGGGVTSVIRGQDFKSGFLSAGFAEFAGPLLPDLGKVGNGIERVVVGGTASVIGGGKFENGAITATYAYLFNDAVDHKRWDGTGPTPYMAQVNQNIADFIVRIAKEIDDEINYVFRSDSLVLGKNLEQVGYGRLSGEDAHHIVAAAAAPAEPARLALAGAGMDINDANNGVFLDRSYHQTLHTNVYYNTVNVFLLGTITYQDAAYRLGLIRNMLVYRTFPH